MKRSKFTEQQIIAILCKSGGGHEDRGRVPAVRDQRGFTPGRPCRAHGQEETG